MKIKNIVYKPILNSLGKWTVEIQMFTEKNEVLASVPEGESSGKFEAKPADVKRAEQNFEKIKCNLIENEYKDIKEFDARLIELDGTADKSELGANLILALSIAFSKLLAKENNKPTYKLLSEEFGFEMKIPQFFLLIFEGGKHGSKHITMQEFMLVTKDIEEAQSTIKTYKDYLVQEGLFTGYGLEGAFTSSTLNDAGVLELLQKLTPEKQIALDVAESSREGELVDYGHVIDKYNIFSIEDPKDEQDYKGWKDFFEKHGNKVLVVADDLTTSNKTLINNAHKEKLANAVIIKPNQIGTVSETMESVKLAKEYGWKIIVSHRGGDTNDDFISDLAVGVGADYVKFGGLQRGERIAKYNRWLEIRNELRI